MTSPVAIIGLVWDGFDLQRADLDILFEITEGLDELPDTRGVDQVIPFRRGRLPSDHIADRRAIVATGWITGRTPTPTVAFRAYLDSLKARLDPTGPPRLLVATLENGTTRWINAVPRNLIGGVGGASDLRRFSIEWEALDPHWYGSWGILALDGGYVLDAGEVLDSGAEVIIAGSGVRAIDTQGTAAVERVRVRIEGPSTGPVGLETVGSSPVGFRVARTLAAGEVLEVDNDARTCTLAGVSLRDIMTLSPGNRHGEYIRLPAGPVTLRAIGAATTTRVLFNPTWQ